MPQYTHNYLRLHQESSIVLSDSPESRSDTAFNDVQAKSFGSAQNTDPVLQLGHYFESVRVSLLLMISNQECGDTHDTPTCSLHPQGKKSAAPSESDNASVALLGQNLTTLLTEVVSVEKTRKLLLDKISSALGADEARLIIFDPKKHKQRIWRPDEAAKRLANGNLKMSPASSGDFNIFVGLSGE